jgi:hypothetical protein
VGDIKTGSLVLVSGVYSGSAWVNEFLTIKLYSLLLVYPVRVHVMCPGPSIPRRTCARI